MPPNPQLKPFMRIVIDPRNIGGNVMRQFCKDSLLKYAVEYDIRQLADSHYGGQVFFSWGEYYRSTSLMISEKQWGEVRDLVAKIFEMDNRPFAEVIIKGVGGELVCYTRTPEGNYRRYVNDFVKSCRCELREGSLKAVTDESDRFEATGKIADEVWDYLEETFRKPTVPFPFVSWD